MLLRKADSCLVLVDVQEKLIPLIFNQQAVLDRCRWLVELSQELSVPLLVSEQYPQGLGVTSSFLKNEIQNYEPLTKVHFSCWRDENFKQAMHLRAKKQIILMGIETHVCVLQTAMDLMKERYAVFIVADAVGSRFETDHKYGLKRMKQAGIELVTAEMIFFEWLEHSKSPEFKRLSRRFFQEEGV